MFNWIESVEELEETGWFGRVFLFYGVQIRLNVDIFILEHISW